MVPNTHPQTQYRLVQSPGGSRYHPMLLSNRKAMLNFQVPKHLSRWVENSLHTDSNVLATSNQGTVLLFREAGMEFVIKTAMGRGAVRRARQATLEREHQAYERMEGLAGVPRCYGLVDKRYLVLEYIHGIPYREAEIEDRQSWFDDLLTIIRGFHERGVSHGDLKSKSNLVMTGTGRPCVIDFGTTVLLREGFHPINNRMFDYACQLDINAWVKHKYQGNYESASLADKALLKDSYIERWLRKRRRRKERRNE
jgi:predicted Ser/Thr protein kinase